MRFLSVKTCKKRPGKSLRASKWEVCNSSGGLVRCLLRSHPHHTHTHPHRHTRVSSSSFLEAVGKAFCFGVWLYLFLSKTFWGLLITLRIKFKKTHVVNNFSVISDHSPHLFSSFQIFIMLHATCLLKKSDPETFCNS